MIKKIIFVIATFLVLSESAYVDTLNKCQASDKLCTKNLLEKLLADISTSGIPEIDMPPLDPLALSNVNIKILNDVDASLVDGTVEGIKNCKINEFWFAVENKKAILDLTCDLIIKGTYKLFSSAPAITSLTGGKPIHGDGVGKIEIEKLNLKLDFTYKIEKKGDDIFIHCQDHKTKYEYSGPENMKFEANNLYLGDVESSKQLVELLNTNWKILLPAFSGGVFGKVVEILSVYTHKFFDKVPTHNYITDDLSSFVS